MSLEERTYSVLIVSSAEKMNTALSSFLSGTRYDPVRIVSGSAEAKRARNERDYDFILINSPLPDDVGIRLAVDFSDSRESPVLLMIRADSYEEISEKVIRHGVFTIPKPISRSFFSIALNWLESARERMRKFEEKALSFEEKMEEIRLVNRAKWLLISELEMDEPQAHRYIEKQAMDLCVPKRVVAQEIIRTYA